MGIDFIDFLPGTFPLTNGLSEIRNTIFFGENYVPSIDYHPGMCYIEYSIFYRIGDIVVMVNFKTGQGSKPIDLMALISRGRLLGLKKINLLYFDVLVIKKRRKCG